jgi:septum formation topological specificity factor MinE
MVVRNKVYRVIDAYRSLLKTKAKQHLVTVGKLGLKGIKKGNKSKNRILDFFLANNRWPSRISENKRERVLGYRFENFVSKEAASHDPNFRRLAMATGRTSNHKRKHDVAQFKKDIVEFLQQYGRVPSTSYEYQTVEGEARLRHKLDYYTKKRNDMTLLGTVYKYDKCHLSGIPVKYRKILNEQLDLEKPLIRMV